MTELIPGEPVDLTTAIGDEIQLIRLGSVDGLGIATRDGAVMATVFPAEARRIAAELTRLVGRLTGTRRPGYLSVPGRPPCAGTADRAQASEET